MEDILVIKQKTYELKQYANAILEDIDIKLAEERKSYETLMGEVAESKAKEIGQLNDLLSIKDDDIKALRDDNNRLKATVKNIKNVIGSAIEIYEGAE